MSRFALSYAELQELSLGELLIRAMPVVYWGEAPLGTSRDKLAYRERLPTIVCRDGTTLSVQAGTHNYCSPRDNYGPYREVEVGYPSQPVPSTWRPYADADPEDWVDGVSGPEIVFAYIPIELVHFYIASHGGIDHERTFGKEW